jgi:hypothetical protein
MSRRRLRLGRIARRHWRILAGAATVAAIAGARLQAALDDLERDVQDLVDRSRIT